MFDGKQSGVMAFAEPLDIGLPESYAVLCEAELLDEVDKIIEENEALKAKLKQIQKILGDHT